MPDCEQINDEHHRKYSFDNFVDARHALDNNAQFVATCKTQPDQHSSSAVCVLSDTRNAYF
jgi:hypothetical protein